MSKTYSAGIVTAYGAAKRAGYTGTYEDFCRQQAGYAGNAAAVEQAKTDAINAKNDAVTAKNTAVSAKDDAISAKNTATTKAYEASQSATSAGQSATSASQSATNASQSATSAGQSATNAEQSAQSVSASAQQIATNKADISQIKADLVDVPNRAVKSAEQLISDKRTTDKMPYKYRASQSGKSDRAYDCIVGGTVGFNQLCNGTSVDTVSGRKYLTKISSAWAIVSGTGSAITGLTSGTDMVMDLTAMFGSAIADHIYALEQATAGAGVALFRQMFPNDYYAYNAGQLISVEGLVAHVMRDADNNIIGSYPLDNSLTLRGVPVLKDGKIEFDGDKYEADGTVTRRYGIVDLGRLTWYAEIDNRFRAAMNNITPLIRFLGSIICTEYNGVKINTLENIQDKDISVTNSQAFPLLRIKDSTKASLTEVEFKASLSGVYLVYELATPTTEEATPYTNPQVVSPYGTEEYVSTSVCPVGHITEYPDNLRAKLDGLPWDLSMIAPVETAYTATRNYTTGQLLIVDNTLYKVTANIANGGTITVGTNVVSTTLSEVIASLS